MKTHHLTGLLAIALGWLAGHTVAGRAAEPAANRIQFHFRESWPTTYRVDDKSALVLLSATKTGNTQWLKAYSTDRIGSPVEFGDRVVLRIQAAMDVRSYLDRNNLQLSRNLGGGLYILQAPDTWTALTEAQRLSASPGVIACHPVKRRQGKLHGGYAPKPNDPYYQHLWHLENRDTNGKPLGIDLNARAAWATGRGSNILIAMADDGVEMEHPDLKNSLTGAPHYNFHSRTPDGNHMGDYGYHGTLVAGVLAAEGNNQRGIVGLAPAARLASWVIFTDDETLPDDEALMDMYQYQSNRVSIQNHSWGNASPYQVDASELEMAGVSNAVAYGRDGLGVIMVRSGGNGRKTRENANDDGYLTNPQIMAVAAVRIDGRAASYSSPGANLLVAAPSGDDGENFPNIFTTDRLGQLGNNQISFTNDLADYAFDAYGFSGTSASAPMISGLAALMLEANPRLTWRDVQQVLIFSARQTDAADPGLSTNGAGFAISHNTGFGLPDAGRAVELARSWKTRPASEIQVRSQTNDIPIPNAGVRLLLSGDNVPESLTNVYAIPSEGPYPGLSPRSVPLVDAGGATGPISANLTGKAALIQRGGNLFEEKIGHAARAGASWAVVYNNRDTDAMIRMGNTEYTSIPAVFIDQRNGEAIRDLLKNDPTVEARIQIDAATYSFEITNTLQLESVQLRVSCEHERRGDLRIALRSPQGTTSVLQELNSDDTPALPSWTYLSRRHFGEGSAGAWTVTFVDELGTNTGTVHGVDLVLSGVPIADSDRDGLDDAWETRCFGSLGHDPREDADGDGYSNAQEFILGTDPTRIDTKLQLDFALYNETRARLSWPSQPHKKYEIWRGDSFGSSFTRVETLPATFPRNEWFAPFTDTIHQFFQVREVAE